VAEPTAPAINRTDLRYTMLKVAEERTMTALHTLCITPAASRTLGELQDAGLIHYYGGTYALTATGAALLKTWEASRG
jgi:predicted transcriptional regulator